MITQTVRRQFLKYFKEKQHAVIPSSPVVPHDDPSLLFTNAGMNQFKDVFLGKSARDYKRAASSQKCIRVGGKHNDFENVGHTSRHLTFFEMLGNFSFGDYFKKEAIQFAWDVSTNIFQLDPNKIWPTVYRDDDEAFELWTSYVPAERITRLGEQDNFWAMGETGPCGPCSELYYDRGPKFGSGRNIVEDVEGERYLEFWNLVFMQYNREESGNKQPLPKPSIDTGAGIERVLNVQMGVESVFETDVLRGLISKIEEISGIPYKAENVKAPAFRVIADHMRCLSFAIADGVQPSNVDRGYVLRKVLRRAVRYGRTLGLDRPFLSEILPQLVSLMGEDYPELVQSKNRIEEILMREEEAFLRTLKRGGNILGQVIEKAQSSSQIISGEDAFKLKDTYGLPLEEILVIAKDSKLTVDHGRYQALEEEAKQRSRNVQKNVSQTASENMFADYVQKNGETQFTGYHDSKGAGVIKAIVIDDQFVTKLEKGQEGLILLDQTPFYAEMGGQVGDTGHFEGKSHANFKINDTKSPFKGVIAHKGKVTEGAFQVGDKVEAIVNQERRQKIANNHTATHLLHWALHKVLGEHVKQAGSVVDDQRLRFDFSHHKALTPENIREIEDLVNTKIRENRPVQAYELPFEDVQKKSEIKQFFGEKYGNVVRVIDIEYSKELCGGTHTSAVGNIGLFRIVKESSIAAGIRRIEAVTGKEAEEFVRQFEDLVNTSAGKLKTQPHQLAERLEKLLEENKQLEQSLKSVKQGQLNGLIQELVDQSEMIGNKKVLIQELSIAIEDLRYCLDQAGERLKSGVVIFAAKDKEKCQIAVRVSDDLTATVSAHEIVKAIAPIIEGSGGGRPNFAQAGGKALQEVKKALDKARELIKP